MALFYSIIESQREREREMETGRNSDGSTVKVIYEKACDDERGPSSIRPKLRPNILELVRFASMPAIIARTYNTHTCIPGVDQNSSSSSKRMNSSSKYSPLLFTLFTHYVYSFFFYIKLQRNSGEDKFKALPRWKMESTIWKKC